MSTDNAAMSTDDATQPDGIAQVESSRFNTAPVRIFQSESNTFGANNKWFTKGVQWSPDGMCALAGCDDNTLRLFELPAEEDTPPDNGCGCFPVALSVHEAETVYDYKWYPKMDSADPGSCVFASTSRDSPIHLWDAFTGQLRASYRSFNHVDEIFAANSIAFDPAGDRIYSGYKAELRMFELSRPGREAQKISTGSRKNGGQRSLISCLEMNPDMSGLLAAGSYDNTVGLYSTNEGLNVLTMFQAQYGGVTQVQFSPNGQHLFSAARKDNNIYCWDIRATGQVLMTMTRDADTNQRIEFDVDPTGRYLATGGCGGHVLIYDMLTGGQLVNQFDPHSDGTNGVSFHPTQDLIATASGQRTFPSQPDSDEEEDQDRTLEDSTRNVVAVHAFAADGMTSAGPGA